MNQNSRIKRNIAAYIVGVLFLATVGGVVTASGSEVGGLLFIISPILMMVLLRSFGGDGWKDAGLNPNLKEKWRWYLFSLLVYPVIMTMVAVLGIILGVTTVNGNPNSLLPAFVAGFAVQLIPRMIFALFEEWGWRGYLEPRLAALGAPDARRHFFVGSVWALWHFPLILSTAYTEIPYAIYFPFFVVAVILTAIVYGQLRKASGTVWTSVVMHGVGNAFGWAILQNNLLTFNNKLLASPAPESVFSIASIGVLGWWMLHKRKTIVP
jgi:membrane protease YdiL (CAAX protease family)